MKAGSGWGGPWTRGLVALVLVADELVEVVLVEVEVVQQIVAVVAHAVEGDADAGEQDEQPDDAPADAAADVGAVVAAEGVVGDPLDQDDGADADEQERPPAAVPGPEREGGQAADLDEEEDDAEADEQNGARDGAAAKPAILGAIGVALGLDLIAHGLGLLAQDALLLLPVAGALWGAFGRGRVGWRIVGHDLPLSLPDVVGDR